MKQLIRFALLAAMITGPGCSTWFGETHFFKSVDSNGEPVNYFKLGVGGGAFLSSSRYVSGYFDEKALDLYFGEIKQPANGQLSQDATNKVISLDRSKGGQLVMILSSNSDAIADQIGQLAENQEIANMLARLMSRSEILAANGAQLDASVQDARGKLLAGLGDQLITGLADDASAAEVDASTLQYANALAAALGSTQTFSSLDEVDAWVTTQQSVVGRAVR